MEMTTTFSPQLLGRTEKTLNAILDRELAGAITEPEWVTLVLTAASRGAKTHAEISARVAQGLRVDQWAAAGRVEQLRAKGLVEVASGAQPCVTLSVDGRRLLDRVQTQVGEITVRLWGDIPPGDLEAAGRVLSTVLDRAEDELGATGSSAQRGLPPTVT
jgi:hypothetical protein